MLIGLFAACLPPVGTLLPLTAEVRAPSGVVVRVFDPRRTDAEFRGCVDGECRIMMHGRERQGAAWVPRPFERRGFGPVVVLPIETFEQVVRLPACAPAPPVEAPESRPPDRPVRRPRRQARAFEPPPIDARLTTPLAPPRAPPSGPPVRTVIARAMIDGPTDSLPGLSVAAPTSAGREATQAGRFTTQDRRVSGRVLPDGRVHFEGGPTVQSLDDPAPVKGNPWDRFPPMAGGVGGRGEGLNALDGADIYAPQKRAFLEETRAERFEMYRRHRRSRLVDHSALHRACAAALDLPAAARKTRLFLLWDEVETAPAAEAQASADAARHYIEEVIRARLPRGAGGYSVEEIIELNLCRAPPLFDPYADPDLPAQVARRCE